MPPKATQPAGWWMADPARPDNEPEWLQELSATIPTDAEFDEMEAREDAEIAALATGQNLDDYLQESSSEALNLPVQDVTAEELCAVDLSAFGLAPAPPPPTPLPPPPPPTSANLCQHSAKKIQYVRAGADKYLFRATFCGCSVDLTREQVTTWWPRKGAALLRKLDGNEALTADERTFTVRR